VYVRERGERVSENERQKKRESMCMLERGEREGVRKRDRKRERGERERREIER
jgi:hypothetical protein